MLIPSYDGRVSREIKRLEQGVAVALLAAFRPQDPVGYLEEKNSRPMLIIPASGPSIRKTAILLRQLGFGVNLWVCDAPERLRELAAGGLVSGLITNFPQRLEPILRELLSP